jgi:N-acetyl-anhydromuramyl-L-alanine amidase AmpD
VISSNEQKPPSVRDAARSDPIGAGIIVCAVALVALSFVHIAPEIDIELPTWRWPQLPELLTGPRPIPKPVGKPPDAWRVAARTGDVLAVPGVPVAYWGRPDAVYGARVTGEAVKPIAVVVHFTDDSPILNLVKYQHTGDTERGGSYGYHFYIDASGRVLQGAPLSVRTNHIKPRGAMERKAAGNALDGTNTIGVGLVGACKSPPLSPITYRCHEETPTQAQIESGLAVVKSLQRMYGMSCGQVYGHGDLQTDRKSFEGVTLARRAVDDCGGSDRIVIDAQSTTAHDDLERAYKSGFRRMLFINDSAPRVVATRGAAQWRPQDPSRPFAGPVFANQFIANHPEYVLFGR